MPRYYSGANPTTAFSDGLMTGFEFVDRIQQRRRALELEERAQSRADRGMALAENSDRRAQTAAEVGEQERVRDNEREDVIDARQTTLFEQGQDEFQRNRRVRDETEAARGALAESMFSASPPSLGAIGAAGATPRTRAPQATAPTVTNVRDNGQATDVPDSVQLTGPVDLRAAQAEKPSGFQRIGAALTQFRDNARAADAKNFWRGVADVSDDSKARIRTEPEKHIDSYLKERESVDPKDRASIDLTMANALKSRKTQLIEQARALDPNDARAGSRLQRQVADADRHLDSLARATTSSAAADAGITRPVKVDDPRVVPAITAAADRARRSQAVLETTPDELRAATTVVNRVGNAKRLNQKQIAALTTLYAHGQIDAEQLNNWSKYGTPIAPKPQTIQALGGGYAAVVSEQGISIVRLPGNAKEESASSRSNQRLLVNDRLKQIDDGLKGMVEAGELSEGSANQHFNKFLQIVKREAPNLQLKSGIPLLGPDGALNLSDTDPGEVAETLEMYRQYDKGEEQPWFFKGGKTFSEYAPQAPGGEEITDLTSAFQ